MAVHLPLLISFLRNIPTFSKNAKFGLFSNCFMKVTAYIPRVRNCTEAWVLTDQVGSWARQVIPTSRPACSFWNSVINLHKIRNILQVHL